MTHNLATSCVAASGNGAIGLVEMICGGLMNIQARSVADLPQRTADEAKACSWDPKLSDPKPNFTFEARVDEAIKAARDLFEAHSDPWPVVIWEWHSGGYGYGCSIPEDTNPILIIDGPLGVFGGTRRAAR